MTGSDDSANAGRVTGVDNVTGSGASDGLGGVDNVTGSDGVGGVGGVGDSDCSDDSASVGRVTGVGGVTGAGASDGVGGVDNVTGLDGSDNVDGSGGSDDSGGSDNVTGSDGVGDSDDSASVGRVTGSGGFDSVDSLRQQLDEVDYLASSELATALFLAASLPQPLLLEGEAGVGKTEAAKALATVLDTPLLRLQCYEGIDAAEALYEWNYPRQLLGIRLAEAAGSALAEDDLFSPAYLIARPLLQAVEHPGPRPAVLLVDEIDRADDEFEAFLLQLLAEGAVTIPELGTIEAAVAPIVVLTSNRTRDLHDALKRRCLYHWIDYPPLDAVVRILRRRTPAASRTIADQVATAVARLRTLDLQKPPGIAESIDWTRALTLLGITTLTPDAAAPTLGSVLKYREDQQSAHTHGLPHIVEAG